ncbi:hypothetical protein EDC44_13232 [Cricetibacter osteomyelitidis]|uniref:Uncharacterized protein n=1 Tax=Cricetibacter osteomyelitidis TaxID=1521931 RepID=A0A4R2T8R9_9PAST|nr:hypothetical protein [Cricetibacter osteomyelitidis]TCP91292.1 hypothetical protein EDC44_13232 [Cricetibacter osteomyelitidis]
MLLILCLMLGGLFYWLINRPQRIMTLGTFRQAKTVRVNEWQFYIEEVAFKDYQAAIHGYFNIAPQLEHYATVQEVNYDFFDFFSVVLRFEDCTMKLVRQIDKVRLIKSLQPMSIAEFEARIVPIVYRDI